MSGLTADKAEATATEYRQYIRLVRWVARRFAWRHGFVVDMEDEAESFLGVLLCERWDEWDPARATRPSWIVKHVRWHLGKWLRWKLSRREVSLGSIVFNRHEGALTAADEQKPDLSDATRQVFERLRAGAQLPRVLRDKPTQPVFREWLRSVFGWSEETINDVVREFQVMFYREPANGSE